eukprot:TRINITY_DN24290_c0_g1_i1.p1 TRINITY_DN24290_c0_g1~~TRINITY_DN24290_c0_g1_i1.p1  ORF type:complete len:1327 (+),score=232.83 TRINITY_DN24290_c0_g1_i1:78-4058(+)
MIALAFAIAPLLLLALFVVAVVLRGRRGEAGGSSSQRAPAPEWDLPAAGSAALVVLRTLLREIDDANPTGVGAESHPSPTLEDRPAICSFGFDSDTTVPRLQTGGVGMLRMETAMVPVPALTPVKERASAAAFKRAAGVTRRSSYSGPGALQPLMSPGARLKARASRSPKAARLTVRKRRMTAALRTSAVALLRVMDGADSDGTVADAPPSRFASLLQRVGFRRKSSLPVPCKQAYFEYHEREREAVSLVRVAATDAGYDPEAIADARSWARLRVAGAESSRLVNALALWFRAVVDERDEHTDDCSYAAFATCVTMLGFLASAEAITAAFEAVRGPGDEAVSFADYLAIFRRLQGCAAADLFYDQYCDDDRQLLGVAELAKFLKDVQKEPGFAAETVAREAIRSLRRRFGASTTNAFTRDSFGDWLLDADCPVTVPLHPRLAGRVYHDMTQPLNSYYIESSHNTYLEGHQLYGKSSAEIYGEVLMMGCRCVEIDCWNGSGGEPQVTHGRTLCSAVTFRSVVEVIARCAFHTRDGRENPYPIVLSLEMHCSDDQQRRIAEHMTAVFGSRLEAAPEPGQESQHFSPEALRFKVLTKAKVLRMKPTDIPKCIDTSLPQDGSPFSVASPTSSCNSPPLRSSFPPGVSDTTDSGPLRSSAVMTAPAELAGGVLFVSTNDLDDSEQLPPRRAPVPASPKKGVCIKLPSSRDLGARGDESPFPERALSTPNAAKVHVKSALTKRRSQASDPDLPVAEGKRQPHGGGVVAELAKWVYLPQVKIADPAKPPSFTCNSISSFSEDKMDAFWVTEHGRKRMYDLSKKMLFRVYPKGLRVTSSNYDPRVAWGLGAHCVALNYQKADSVMLRLNDAVFQDNGGCGYLLQPSCPAAPDGYGDPLDLSVTLLAVQGGGARPASEAEEVYIVLQVRVVVQADDPEAGSPCRDPSITLPLPPMSVQRQGVLCMKEWFTEPLHARLACRALATLHVEVWVGQPPTVPTNSSPVLDAAADPGGKISRAGSAPRLLHSPMQSPLWATAGPSTSGPPSGGSHTLLPSAADPNSLSLDTGQRKGNTGGAISTMMNMIKSPRAKPPASDGPPPLQPAAQPGRRIGGGILSRKDLKGQPTAAGQADGGEKADAQAGKAPAFSGHEQAPFAFPKCETDIIGDDDSGAAPGSGLPAPGSGLPRMSSGSLMPTRMTGCNALDERQATEAFYAQGRPTTAAPGPGSKKRSVSRRLIAAAALPLACLRRGVRRVNLQRIPEGQYAVPTAKFASALEIKDGKCPSPASVLLLIEDLEVEADENDDDEFDDAPGVTPTLKLPGEYAPASPLYRRTSV